MNINNNSNKLVSFGWYTTIHGNVTKSVGKKLGLSSNLLKKIAYYAQKPDFDEIFLFRQKHYFYPNKNKSFLDITKTRNAKYAYKKHINKMKKAFSMGEQDKAINEAGRALHFLQDMSQPHHIEEGSFFQKVKTAIFPHIAFETKIHTIQNDLYNKSKPINIDAKNFDELFKSTLQLSQKIEIPQKSNQDNWTNIGQKAINITIASTNKFFELVKNYLK